MNSSTSSPSFISKVRGLLWLTLTLCKKRFLSFLRYLFSMRLLRFFLRKLKKFLTSRVFVAFVAFMTIAVILHASKAILSEYLKNMRRKWEARKLHQIVPKRMEENGVDQENRGWTAKFNGSFEYLKGLSSTTT